MAIVTKQLEAEDILITGGAGFIGSHIADTVIENNDVTIYDDFSAGTLDNVPDEATIIEDDIRQEQRLADAVVDADIVFHQAAQVSVQWSVKNPAKSHTVNLDPLMTILETARGTDKRIVFASSAAIYGNPEYVPINESHPKDPTSPYGLEKLTADQYCHLYHDLYGVEAVALRYFNVYGPRQKGGDYAAVIPIFRDQAVNNEPITIEGDGTQTRDFVHIDDVVQANLRAATDNNAPGKAFNIGTGSQITIQELAETVKMITDSDSDIVHVAEREGDIEQSVADISRAREVLGYEPAYDMQSGLEAYLQ